MAEKKKIRRLILVYNADSGTLAAVADSARKLLRLNGCTLCAVTHGVLGEKSEWKDCQAELGVPIDYRHRDELFGRLKEAVRDRLPSVVAETSGGFEMLLSPEVLERCRGSVSDFKGRLVTHAAMRDLELSV